jgi:ubiquinone/menaquinone biosynthesis C-methylase UbiE
MVDIYEIMAKYYDEMYAWKDYEKETERLVELVNEFKSGDGKTLLDVGCGSGGHIAYLRHHYTTTGVDLSENMLQVAKERFNDVEFIQQDMSKMNIGRTYDIVTCLFGGIGHLTKEEDIIAAIDGFANHTNSGGVVIIEPFVTKESVHPTSIGILTLDKPDIKIARVNASKMEGDILYLNFNFLVATEEGVEHIVDPCPMGVFPRTTFQKAMEESGLKTEYVEPGLMQRTGLFVGVKQ